MMKCFFNTCAEAVENATNSKKFGMYCSKKKNQNQDVHIHECCEVFLCVEGGKSFLIDNKIYRINDGEINLKHIKLSLMNVKFLIDIYFMYTHLFYTQILLKLQILQIAFTHLIK